MTRLEDLTRDANVIAVTCGQWGDSGKGKIVDWLAEYWADIIVRGQGGDNAGHTVVVNGAKRVFHLIPSGITQDEKGKTTMLGQGMVINPASALEEIKMLQASGVACNHLMISQDAHAIMPYQVKLDMAKDKSQAVGIGSTGKGIGPCYTDKHARRGITLGELLDEDVLREKLDRVLPWYGPHIGDILGINDWPTWNRDEIMERMRPLAEQIRPFLRDTLTEVRKLRDQGKRALVEGAQGGLLSIDHGTYPFVTSSDCLVSGMVSGSGIPVTDVSLAYSIIKFPIMTRVGLGPFPTEFGGRESELYCAVDAHRKKFELDTYGIPYTEDHEGVHYDAMHPTIIEMLNSPNPFMQGVAARLVADEYGATTGRARRTGRTDAVSGRYMRGLNGVRMIATKPDTMSEMKKFDICFGYELPDGSVTKDFQKNERFLRSVKPVYKRYEGYGDISDVRSYERLPPSLRSAMEDFEESTGGKFEIVSVGADRDATFIR